MISNFPYEVRVLQARGELPYSVKIILPRADGRPSIYPRDPQSFYIEDALPSSEEHHTILGAFVAQWGQLEVNLESLFRTLAGLNAEVCSCIVASMGTKQIIESTASLASLRLPESGRAEISALLERITKAASRRNFLIHGHWIAEVVIWPYKGDVKAKVQILRLNRPSDKTIETKLSDARNQKERTKYLYTVKRLMGAISDTAKLSLDIARFTDRLPMYLSKSQEPA
jgi:hypothetical protein